MSINKNLWVIRLCYWFWGQVFTAQSLGKNGSWGCIKLKFVRCFYMSLMCKSKYEKKFGYVYSGVLLYGTQMAPLNLQSLKFSKLNRYQTKTLSKLHKAKICWSKKIFSCWSGNIFLIQIWNNFQTKIHLSFKLCMSNTAKLPMTVNNYVTLNF